MFTALLWVCGPLTDDAWVRALLDRYTHCEFFAWNVSLVQGTEVCSRFKLIWERDGDRLSRPDVTMLCRSPRAPVVGVIRVTRQSEYGERCRHGVADEAIHRLIAGRDVCAVKIDTVLEQNCGGLRTPAQIESLISAMDVVITTRLHGMVFALKNNVPVIAIDPIAKGAKVRAQAEALGWPVVFMADVLTEEALNRAFDYCLTPLAAAKVRRMRIHAREHAERDCLEFMRSLTSLQCRTGKTLGTLPNCLAKSPDNRDIQSELPVSGKADRTANWCINLAIELGYREATISARDAAIQRLAEECWL